MDPSGRTFQRYVTASYLTCAADKWFLHKICVQVMRNTLGEDERGYRLLRCVRAYVELDVLASFELHTDETIRYGKTVAERFVKLANVSHLFHVRKTLQSLMCSGKFVRSANREPGTSQKCT